MIVTAQGVYHRVLRLGGLLCLARHLHHKRILEGGRLRGITHIDKRLCIRVYLLPYVSHAIVLCVIL